MRAEQRKPAIFTYSHKSKNKKPINSLDNEYFPEPSSLKCLDKFWES